MVLPSVTEKVVKEFEGTIVPYVIVIYELRKMEAMQEIESEDMAVYI